MLHQRVGDTFKKEKKLSSNFSRLFRHFSTKFVFNFKVGFKVESEQSRLHPEIQAILFVFEFT